MSEIFDIWKPTKTNGHWAKLSDIEEPIKSQLKAENGFKTTIDQYSYTVKVNQDNGSIVVFRNAKRETSQGKNKSFFSKSQYKPITNLKVIPLGEVEESLKDNWYIHESQPVCIIREIPHAIVVKREGSGAEVSPNGGA